MTNTNKKPLDIFDLNNLSDTEGDIFDACVDFARLEAHKIIQERYPDIGLSLGTLGPKFYQDILPVIDLLRTQVELLVDEQESFIKMIKDPGSIKTKPYKEELGFGSRLRFLSQDILFEKLIEQGYDLPGKQAYLHSTFDVYSDFEKVIPIVYNILSADERTAFDRVGRIMNNISLKADYDTVIKKIKSIPEFQEFIDTFVKFYKNNEGRFRDIYITNEGRGELVKYSLKRSQKLIDSLSEAKSVLYQCILNLICDKAYIELKQQGYDIEHVVQLHLGLYTDSPICIHVQDNLVDAVSGKIPLGILKQATKDYYLGEHSSDAIKNIYNIFQEQDIVIEVIDTFIQYYKDSEQEFIDRFQQAEEEAKKTQSSQFVQDIMDGKHLETIGAPEEFIEKRKKETQDLYEKIKSK